MTPRWFLSQFYEEPTLEVKVPVAANYGGQWLCPQLPTTDDGWALVQVRCDPLQMEAAKQDSRVVVLPLAFDPSPVPQHVTDNYAELGATTGMSLGALLAKLAEVEPIYSQSL